MEDKVRKRVLDHLSEFKHTVNPEQIDEIVTLYELNNDSYDENIVSLHVENYLSRICEAEENWSKERRKTVFARQVSDDDYEIKNYSKDKKTFDFLLSRLVRDIPFCLLSNEQKISLVESMSPIVVDEGTVLIKEGDVGEEMYIVEYGEFGVSVREQPKASMKAGDVFGELALLHGIPRTATVTALKQSKVWSATQLSFSCIRIRDQIYRKALLRETLETNDFFKSLLQFPDSIEKIINLSKSIFIDADSPFEVYENEVAVILKEGVLKDGKYRVVHPKDLVFNDFNCITDIECVLISLNS